jgi:hypothetical protein
MDGIPPAKRRFWIAHRLAGILFHTSRCLTDLNGPRAHASLSSLSMTMTMT